MGLNQNKLKITVLEEQFEQMQMNMDIFIGKLAELEKRLAKLEKPKRKVKSDDNL